MQNLAPGLAGLQGPFYGGTNCFHRRKVIYGRSPDNIEKGTLLLYRDIFIFSLISIGRGYLLLDKDIFMFYGDKLLQE